MHLNVFSNATIQWKSDAQFGDTGLTIITMLQGVTDCMGRQTAFDIETDTNNDHAHNWYIRTSHVNSSCPQRLLLRSEEQTTAPMSIMCDMDLPNVDYVIELSTVEYVWSNPDRRVCRRQSHPVKILIPHT